MPTCSKCGGRINFGDNPFCNPNGGEHEPMGNFFVGNAKRFDPVVVFRDASGNITPAAHTSERTPRGCRRVEVDSIQGVRRLEGEMSAQSQREREQRIEREAATFEPYRKQKRSELMAKLPRMSAGGQDFARRAMAHTDQKTQQHHQRYDPGVHIDAFANDRSSRVAHSDESTVGKARE